MASAMKVLSGKTALVTGGGTRIGRALALRLAREGCNVIIHYNTSRAGANATVKQIRQLGVKSGAIAADLSLPTGPLTLALAVAKSHSKLDILVNSASWWPAPEKLSARYGLLHETFENWEKTLAVNTRAPFFLLQKLAPLLARSKSASVVNIIDQSISEPFLDRASHSISKSALAAVTKLAAMELVGKIRVNALELGAILPPQGMPEKEKKKRQWGGAKSVEDALMFVLTNSFVNGEIIPLRGNRHLERRGKLEAL